MDVQKLVTVLREASRVKRCHTLPIHGEYTVGQHSFDMLMLLLALWPGCRKELMVAVISHDIPERWTGDMPAPTKWSLGGDLIKKLDQIDERILETLQMNQALDANETAWLHALDRVELLLWAKEQLAMGNQNVAPMIGVLLQRFRDNPPPPIIQRFLEEHSWTRTSDLLP